MSTQFAIKDKDGICLKGEGTLVVTIPSSFMKTLPDDLVTQILAHSIS